MIRQKETRILFLGKVNVSAGEWLVRVQHNVLQPKLFHLPMKMLLLAKEKMGGGGGKELFNNFLERDEGNVGLSLRKQLKNCEELVHLRGREGE